MRPTIPILVGIAAAWLYTRERDVRRWPEAIGRELGVLRGDLTEAATAGRDAARRRESEIDADIAAAGR